MNRRQMFMDGYENGVADAQSVLMAARKWPDMGAYNLLLKLEAELDKLRAYSKE